MFLTPARTALVAPVLVFLGGCHLSGSPAPSSTQSAAYVVTLGSDTVAVDQYSRVGDRIEGTLLLRAPRVAVTRYTITLNPSGRPALMEFNTRLPDGSLVPNGARSVTVTFSGDSAVTQVMRDTLNTLRLAAKDAFPFLNNAISLYALPIAALNASGRDSGDYAVYGGGARTTAVSVAKKGTNKYWVWNGGYVWEITTNDAGQVETMDASRTTQHFWSKRQSSVDIASLTAAWASRAAGPLSSRDTVNAKVGSATLWVDYGRPLARGRRVFGSNGVLGDTIWRTGANAATQFTTSAPLTIAGQTIPAGTYTLWTLAVPGRYQLIFNKQTRQWGTEYHPEQDLVRVPLQAVTLPSVVERFTILVEPTMGNMGAIRLRWDTMELSLPFTAP